MLQIQYNSIGMGNRSLNSDSLIRELGSWAETGSAEHFAYILKNPETGQEIQKFIVGHIDSDNINTELKVYFLRKTELPRSVRVIRYGYEKSSSICASTEYFVVLTERTTRLSDLSALSLTQASTFLEQCIRGFSLLFELFGLFTITADLIALNDQEDVKVWINENFGLNTIEEDPTTAVSESHQMQLLVDIIKKGIREEEKPDSFANEFLACSKFEEAVRILDRSATRRNSLEATASFPTASSVSDSSLHKNVENQQQNTKPKNMEVKIMFKNPEPTMVRKQAPAMGNPQMGLQFRSRHRTDETVLQTRNVLNFCNFSAPSSPPNLLTPSKIIHKKLSTPCSSAQSPTHSSTLIHYAPVQNLKRSIVFQSQQPIPDQFRNMYRIPVVDSEIVIQKVNYPVENFDLSRLKRQGAVILESRVVTHP